MNTCFDLLPSSSLPPRKRMKFFLEPHPSCDVLLFHETFPSSSSSPPPPPPKNTLSSDASSLLMKYLSSSQQFSISYLEQLLDHSPACGNKQRSMLTSLCHQWTGDIRVIHANLQPEISSFLPHILLINILSTKY